LFEIESVGAPLTLTYCKAAPASTNYNLAVNRETVATVRVKKARQKQ
jgi:hypothetical protein